MENIFSIFDFTLCLSVCLSITPKGIIYLNSLKYDYYK